MMLGGTLVALGVGYVVYVTATKEKEGVKLLGQALGIFIMIVAFLGTLCGAMKCAAKGMSVGCPMVSGYAKHCPMKGDMGDQQ